MNKLTHADVEVIEDQISFKGFYQLNTLALRHKLFLGGWSKTVSRELFKRHDAVGVLLYDPLLDAVALVEQFRIGVFGSDVARKNHQSPWILELVAGLIDKEEVPAEVARREAFEESGIIVEDIEPVGEYYSSPGGSNEYFYSFIGRADLTHAGGIHGLENEGEDIKVHLIQLDELWSKLDQGVLINAHTLIAVQWLKLHYKELKLRWS
jgi:ADP-ribose pyrophosphatase|tara:strand:- start:1118 stop:1744 length:627 start_codon:yes stop_codon:yes gene_type:complete